MTTRPGSAGSVLVLPKASRAYLVGETGTGKSTLAEILALNYIKEYSKPKTPVRTLVIDTKPRFIAEHELNGFTTKQTGRYKKWGIGSDVFKGSFALARKGSIKSELDRVWALGGNIAICHAEGAANWGYASEVTRIFYESYGAKVPRLVFVDELADFYKYRSMGEIYERIARNGRERNVSLIACSQRPRKVPTEVMTELKRLYMFQLSYKEDIKHIAEFGIPENTAMPEGHVFYMFDKELRMRFPSNGYHELELKNG